MIDRCNEQNTSPRRVRVDFPKLKIDEDVLEYIEIQKPMKTSVYSSEIQQILLLDGVVHLANQPSVSQINIKVIREDIVMARKKLTSIPLQSTNPSSNSSN